MAHLLPSVFERKWPTVILTPISIVDFLVTVSSTRNLHSKQIVVLSKTGQTDKEFEIKRIESDTTLRLGPKDSGRMQEYSNPTEFSGGTLAMHEQNRNPMGWEIVGRAVYAEEPIVALRTILIDPWGQKIDSIKDGNGINRLAVDANISVDSLDVDIDNPNNIISVNTPMSVINTESFYVLPPETKRYMIRVRDGEATLKLAFAAGLSGTNFVRVPRGTHFNSGDIDYPSVGTLGVYFQVDKTSIVEIVVWKRL